MQYCGQLCSIIQLRITKAHHFKSNKTVLTENLVTYEIRYLQTILDVYIDICRQIPDMLALSIHGFHDGNVDHISCELTIKARYNAFCQVINGRMNSELSSYRNRFAINHELRLNRHSIDTDSFHERNSSRNKPEKIDLIHMWKQTQKSSYILRIMG